MNIHLVTEVAGTVPEVFARFDQQLLAELTPPGVQLTFVEVEDPTHIGAIIHIRVKLLGIFRQEWRNYVSELSVQPHESYFTDEGQSLPRVLKSWRHRHIVRQKGNHVEIVDDIRYEGAFGLLGWAMYPFLWAQFAYRKPVYRKIFGKPS